MNSLMNVEIRDSSFSGVLSCFSVRQCFICGEPVEEPVVDLDFQRENEVLQQEQAISSVLICGIMSQFLIFVRSNQVSIVGSVWDGFHSSAMPDSRMPEEREIPRAVDAHRLLDHPPPSGSVVAPAPEDPEARTIVGCPLSQRRVRLRRLRRLRGHL